MDVFSKSDLKALIGVETVGCVSISLYMPTIKAGRAEIQQNPVRLKHLLHQARERLEKIGLKPVEAERYLRPAERLLDDNFFWVNMSDGLVIFLSQDYFRYYRLPVQFPEMLIVADRFHVKPLLPLLASDGRFYAIAISQKVVRLLECTRFGFRELNIAGKIPGSVAEALNIAGIDHERSLGAVGRGGQAVTAHGAEVEDTKDDLLRFFQSIDRSLQREFLHNETAPLVLMSVDYLFPIYKKANTYEYLLNDEVEGSPDKMTAIEIHKRAVSVVEPLFKQRQEAGIRHYEKSVRLGSPNTTTDLKRLVTESYQGKVSLLFVAVDKQQWGAYDPSTNRVSVHSKEESCDVDLLDFIAAHTLAHRGEVYAVESDKVPDGPLAAAVLRY